MERYRLLVTLTLALTATACASGNQVADDTAPTEAPAVVETSTTTAPETTTTESPTTTEPPPETSCSVEHYEVQLPDGWSHMDCVVLTSADSSEEVTISFTGEESYRDALTRFGSTETILAAETSGADGVDGVRLELGPSETSPERTTYILDAGDGAIIASGPSLVVDDIRRTMELSPALPTRPVCTGELMSGETTTVLRSGQADVDDDGDLETFSLVATDGVTEVEIVGLAAVDGNVVGTVQFGRTDPEAVLGWADWDGDGLPEIITREPAGPAFGDVHHVHSIDGCEVERVTTLVNDMRAGSTDVFVCSRDTDGDLSELTMLMIRQDADISPTEITNRSITSIFTAGVAIALETQVTITSDPADLDPPIDGTVNLAGCATLF